MISKSSLLPCLVFLLIPFYTLTAKGQNKADTLSSLKIEKLEKSISKKEDLQQVKQDLEVVKQQAADLKDDVMFCRSLRDLITIKDLRTEDSLYFRNSAFIDTMINDPNTSAGVKSILYVLQAQRIGSFNYHYFRFNAATYRTKNLKHDYAALTQIQRDSLSVKYLNAALINAPFKENASRLLWLSSGPDIFLFEPKFEDIVLAELVNLANRNYSEYNSNLTNRWLSMPSARFRLLVDSLADQPSRYSNFFRYYQRWIQLHAKDQPTAMFIESLLRKQIYMASTQDSVSIQLYSNYLLHSSLSPYPAFNAHAIYQLCLIWNAEGNRYPDFSAPYLFIPDASKLAEYQYFHQKALQLYEQHKVLLAQYPAFNKVLKIMATQILKKGMRVEITDKLSADKDIPFRLIYKNADSLFYRIVRLNAWDTIANKDGTAAANLLNRNVIASDKFVLPLPEDHNSHAAYLKLAALPKGYYSIIFSDKNIQKADSDVHAIAFRITDIAAINTDERIYILNRTTGQPLAGADVRLFKKGISSPDLSPVKTKQAGYITIKADEADSIQVAYKGDTLGYKVSVHANELSDNIYDKDKYDDLNDFYDDKLTMEIFTDRGIYRPGQTVQYKIIFLTRNPYTGGAMLFNRESVGGGNFNSLLAQWLKGKKPVLTINDPFGRTVNTLKININDFGSLAGSFTLPKTAATGSWQIGGIRRVDYQNNGRFEVEEYKRPTIELSMQKQTKTLLPGEPFVIKLKLRSFTGADLSNIPISYTLNRGGNLPVEDKHPGYGTYKNIVLTDSKGYTNSNGELVVSVNDTALLKYTTNKQAQYYSYNLHATAVDATGESAETGAIISVTSRPVRININMDNVYDQQNLQPLNVITTTDFEGNVGRQVAVKLYKVSDPAVSRSGTQVVDQWYYTPGDWNKWFPESGGKTELVKADRILVLDTMINTGTYQKMVLPAAKMDAGFYELIAICEDGEKTLGEYTHNFEVFDSATGKVPVDDINYMPVASAKPGESVTWYSSGKMPAYTIYQAIFETGGKRKAIRNVYEEVNEQEGLRRWNYHIPTDAIGNILLTRVWVANNQIHQSRKTIFVIKPANEDPEIIIEKYRKVMAPGAQESFTVSVKTKNENTAAELMTTLYDASLDKLKNHQWSLPNQRFNQLYLRTNWNYALSDKQTTGDNLQTGGQVVMREISTQPGSLFMEGRVGGVSITNASQLNEVVVVGYGTPGSGIPVMIRGISSINEYKQPLIVVDGQIYTDDMKNISPSAITQILILKGAEASALYGSRAAEGVLIISTKGPIVLPGSEEPVIKIRKNFNETAFFFPQVHAGKDGYYHFSFTMPETATEWNWKMFAQTKDARFAYLERKLQTQMNLMVQPNVPRLLYQGDQIKLKSRVSNLDTASANIKAVCKIEDVLTGEDITSALVGNNIQNISLSQRSTGDVSFLMTVPAGQLHPLKVVISAQTSNASDAEEHIIPVLSSRIFARQSVAVDFKNSTSITLPSAKLPADATPFGIGISITQKPQAALINALPWLANYSYDCAEQTFNKLRARATALKLMRTDSVAQASYKAASLTAQKDKSADDVLPDDFVEDAMPWLNEQNKTSTQQKQLLKLLDTNATKKDINKLLERLYKLQQTDNGLAWFEGGASNSYISAYILAGFGQLSQSGWRVDARMTGRQDAFISNLTAYVQNQFLRDDTRHPDMQLLYALSYRINKNDESAMLSAKINSLLNAQWLNINRLSLEQQALLIINTFRCVKSGDALYEKAEKQLNNIRQLAIEDKENGLRWKAIADKEELNISAEETVALLAEAFELGGENKGVDPGIIKWILTTKQDQHWQTTKATAAAVNLIEKVKGGTFDKTKAFTTELNGQKLSVSDDLLNGTPDAFAAVKQLPETISFHQQGTDTHGDVTWYYFAAPNRLDTLNKTITIKKQFYVSDKVKGWVALAPGAVLNVGDRVKVKLTIETASRLTFVHISDPRAATFEPADNISGYQYSNGFSYYQSVKDTGLDIFAESIPRGISEVDYELVVAMSGQFTSGPAKLQCMYTPSAVAYGVAQKFDIN